MIRTSSKQTGSAHIVIIVIIVVAILGALGFVFWQNFIAKDNKTTPAQVQKTAQNKKEGSAKEITYKTYQTDKHPVAFKYPDTWAIENIRADDQYIFSRAVDVRTDKDVKVSFSVGGQGVGGACSPEFALKSTTIDVVPTAFQTPKPTTLSFTVTPSPSGGYDAKFGLTDYFTELKEVRTCSNTFYYLFSSGSETYMLIGFYGTKHFTSLDGAKKFIASDEYAAIKKMILSLSY